MVTKAELEKLRIDVLDELHEIRTRHVGMSSEEIEKAASEIRKQVQARRKK